jgi:hypothetical protein
MGPRTCLDVVAMRKNPYSCRESNPGRPARSLVTIMTAISPPIEVNEIQETARNAHCAGEHRSTLSQSIQTLPSICEPLSKDLASTKSTHIGKWLPKYSAALNSKEFTFFPFVYPSAKRNEANSVLRRPS